MISADNIDQLVKKLRRNASADLDKRIHDDITSAPAAYDRAESARSRPETWRIIMKSRITQLTGAAIFVAAIVFLHQFDGSIRGTSIAWADVVERLANVSSYKARAHRVLTEVGRGEPFYECDILRYFSPNHGSVEESYVDGELAMLAYSMFLEKSVLIVFPLNKQYVRFELNDELLSVVEYVNPANTDGMMKLFGSERCTRLGWREIDGATAEGFEVKDVKVFSQVPRILLHPKDISIRLWVDEETLLPTRLEGKGFVGKGLLTGFKDFRYEEVMHSIEYDAEIDEGIFEPNIPADYTLIDPAGMALKAESEK